jgi:hypothetical protein
LLILFNGNGRYGGESYYERFERNSLRDTMKLSSKARDKMPKSKFAEPGKKAYPIEDKAHAANAKARATQMVNKGKLSSSEASKIKAKANKVLKGKK